MHEFLNTWSVLLASFPEDQLTRYGIILLRILMIIVGVGLTGRLGRRLIDGILHPGRIPGTWDERRVRTLRGLAQSLLRYSLYFFGGMIILPELGVPTASLLAGAGILGLAVGFGAQNLVRDVITGFFILFEDQYGVGDYVTIAGMTGVVEEMGLRVTKVRESTGELHIVPNGEIKQVTNFSRGGMGVVVDVYVAYEEDLTRASAVIEQACRSAAEGNQDVVLEAPHLLGVTELGELGVTLRVFGKVNPMQQWDFERKLRRQIKEAMDKAGIKRPDPRWVISDGSKGGRGSATQEIQPG